MKANVYKPKNPIKDMNKKIISKVKECKSGQRRITVPTEDETLKHNDLVELKKVEIK